MDPSGPPGGGGEDLRRCFKQRRSRTTEGVRDKKSAASRRVDRGAFCQPEDKLLAVNSTALDARGDLS